MILSNLLDIQLNGVLFMKCKNCKTENIMKADYCKACGHQFTEKEKKKSYNRTVFGLVDNILNLKSYITFDFITGNRWFKVISLVGLILYSLLVLKVNDSKLRILDSGDYDIEYNKTTKEYYLVTEETNIGLELYVPEKSKEINLITVDKNDKQLNSTVYKNDQQVTVSYISDSHYIIQAGKQQLEFFVIME